MTTLSSLIESLPTDKNTIHSYLPTYESLFDENKLNIKIVLEIGVYQGGSIHLWNKYFQNAYIYGIDIEKINPSTVPNSSNIFIFDNQNAYNPLFVCEKVPNDIDIFIDDGPHTLESMVSAIQLYLPKMSNNGIFIIEDVQSIQWIHTLIKAVPLKYRSFIQIADLRNIKNRYDDILFIVNFNQLPNSQSKLFNSSNYETFINVHDITYFT